MHRSISTLVVAALLVITAGLVPARGNAQIQEFDFYAEFRQWRMALPSPVRNQVDEVLGQYQEKLTKEGVAQAEIDRVQHGAECLPRLRCP